VGALEEPEPSDEAAHEWQDARDVHVDGLLLLLLLAVMKTL